jgi:hypothetical protein
VTEGERAALKHHDCREAGEDSWWENDARGIPLNRVCRLCREVKLSVYRPDVLTDSNYWHDEPIDED